MSEHDTAPNEIAAALETTAMDVEVDGAVVNVHLHRDTPLERLFDVMREHDYRAYWWDEADRRMEFASEDAPGEPGR